MRASWMLTGIAGPVLSLFSVACGDTHEPADLEVATAALSDDSPSGWIVTLADGTDPRAFARGASVAPEFVYEHALRGFSVTLPRRAAEALAARPGVLSVIPDVAAHIDGQQVPTGITRIGGPAPVTNAVAVPGIAIIDTGIGAVADLNVVDRVTCSKATRTTPAACTAGGVDDNNHGTHVAGTAAAIDNGLGVVGVYPGAPLYAVKVCDSRGSCDISRIVAGLDWVTARASTIRVANLSLGFAGTADAPSCATTTNALYKAVCGAQAAGVTVVVAAGNETDDAKNHLPAAYPEVITVSALNDNDGTKSGDTFASFSNYGALVDIMAPGVSILSTLPDGTYGSYSGTSMATPHVSGAAARILAANPSYTPAQVRTALLANADVKACPTATGLCSGDPDGIAEPLLWIGQPIAYCTSDASCPSGQTCASGTCVAPACTADSQCADTIACTDDYCVDAGTAAATCDHAYKVCGATSDGCCGPQCSGNPSSSYYDVDCPSAAGWMHVADIAFAVKGKSGWQAFVKIVDAVGAAVPNATVTGTCSSLLLGTLPPFSQVTDATGTAKVLDLISSNLSVLTCSVSQVTHATFVYDAVANVQSCATFDMSTKVEGSCN